MPRKRDFEREDRISPEELRRLLDYDRSTGVFRWRETGKPAGTKQGRYWSITINHLRYYAHRLAWVYVYGYWPEFEIDHRDTNPLNNAIGNLRRATRILNLGNTKLSKANTSGLKGVCRSGEKWRSYISVEGRRRYLGTFDTAEQAHSAYVAAAKRQFGEFARAA